MPLSYKQLLAYIFPPSEDEVILASVSPEQFTKYPPARRHDAITLLPYDVAPVRAAIHLAKFHHHPDAYTHLGNALARFLHTTPHDIVIPVPLSAKRYRARGYNQVTEVIKAAQKKLPALTYNETMLVRTRDTLPQTTLDRQGRLSNLAGAFSIKASRVPANIATCRIILLDDVVTTGSTLRAARAALSTLKPRSITCVALAG